MNIWDAAYKFLSYINSIDSKYQGYIVGGAVRDFLMGIQVHDIDISSNIPFEYLKNISICDMSKNKNGFSTIIVNYDGYKFEVSSIRGKNIYEDLEKRDFTINAMALDKDKNLIISSTLNSKYDFDNKIIKPCSKSSFSDDPLRILRFFRQSIKYNLSYSEDTFNMILDAMHGILNIDKSRINDELLRSFSESKNYSKYCKDLYKCNFIDIYFYNKISYKNYSYFIDRYNNCIYSNKYFSNEEIRLIILAYCIIMNDSEITIKKLKSMKFSNNICNMLEYLIKFDKLFIKNIYNMHRSDIYDMANDYRYDVLKYVYSPYKEYDIYFSYIDDILESSKYFPRNGINGKYLMKKLGISQGKILGDILKKVNRNIFDNKITKDLYDKVIDDISKEYF